MHSVEENRVREREEKVKLIIIGSRGEARKRTFAYDRPCFDRAGKNSCILNINQTLA